MKRAFSMGHSIFRYNATLIMKSDVPPMLHGCRGMASSTNEGKKNNFPQRADSIRKLESKKYDEVADDYDTYGAFVNHCTDEEIETNAKDRRAVMQEMRKKEEEIER